MSIKSWAGNLKSKRRARASAAILFVILLAGGIGSWLYLRDDTEPEPDPASGPLAGEMKFLPDSVTDLAVYQYDIARACSAYTALLKCPGDYPRTRVNPVLGLGDLDIVRVVVVTDPFPLTIVTMRNSISAEAVFAPYLWERLTKSDEDGKRIYVDKSTKTGYWIKGRRIIIADPEKLRQLGKSPNAKPIASKMSSLIQKADFSKPELHFCEFESSGGDFAYAPGTKAEYSAVFHIAVCDAGSPVTILSELDYQTPTNVRVQIDCESAAAANELAREFRKPETLERLGPLRNCVVKVAGSTVTLQAAIAPCDIRDLPKLVAQ